MPDCVFCKIVAGDLPATKVYEDAETLAFLDHRPLAKGHTVVVPKEHRGKLAQLSEDEAVALMRTARQLVPALGRATGLPDATLAIHDGPAAGQEVPHLHLHIVPRKENDGGGAIHDLFEERPEPTPAAMAELAAEVRSFYGQPMTRNA